MTRASAWVPNQHGAWAMLVTPLVVGVVLAGPTWAHLPLAACWLLGYFAFFFASSWLKSRRKARFLRPLQVYAGAAGLTGLVAVMLAPSLLWWPPVFLPLLAAGLWAAWSRHERDLVPGLLTVAAAMLMTPVAYAAGGAPTTPGWPRVWAATGVLAAYFLGTVFYVKSAIRQRGSRRFRWVSVGWHVTCAGLLLPVHWGFTLVLLVLAVRAAVVPPLGWSPKRLGIGEVLATLVVAGCVLTWA